MASNMFSKATSVFKGQGQPGSQSHHEEEQSLTTILSTNEDRIALTMLIADCSEVMRQSIEDVFDPNQTGQMSDMLRAADGHEDMSLEEKDPASQEKLRKELETRQKELSGPKMQELKTDLMAYFDEWRVGVMTRVGEVVNSRDATHESPVQSKPTSESSVQQRTTSNILPDLPEYDPAVKENLLKLYPPVASPLQTLPESQRVLILHSVLLLLLSLKNYQSYSRTLMLHLTTSLNLDVALLAHDESQVAQTLLSAATAHMTAEDETKQHAEGAKIGRKWKIGLATVAGAALIGVTGGLAAPLLAAGLGTVMGGIGLGATATAGYLGALAGSSVLVGGLFGAYGGRMTGKMMEKYAREVSDFAFVPVREMASARGQEHEHEDTRLRVAIGISGWLTKEDEVVQPWKVIGSGLEGFALRWELQALLDLGGSMMTMIKSAAWGYAKVEIIKRTVFASLYAGLWPLAILKVGRVIDNPFSVANHRAVKAGEVLADALINKAQGERPVTLIGYSLGAKVIFTCLQRLAERRAFGLVESVVLMGTPAPSTSADWRLIRSVVSGRVVNVYSTKDYILAFLYRGSSIQFGVAGLQAISNIKGIENVDVSEHVTGHTSYRFLTGPILKQIGFEDVDLNEVKVEVKQLEEAEAEEAKSQIEPEFSDHDREVHVATDDDDSAMNLKTSTVQHS